MLDPDQDLKLVRDQRPKGLSEQNALAFQVFFAKPDHDREFGVLGIRDWSVWNVCVAGSHIKRTIYVTTWPRKTDAVLAHSDQLWCIFVSVGRSLGLLAQLRFKIKYYELI